MKAKEQGPTYAEITIKIKNDPDYIIPVQVFDNLSDTMKEEIASIRGNSKIKRWINSMSASWITINRNKFDETTKNLILIQSVLKKPNRSLDSNQKLILENMDFGKDAEILRLIGKNHGRFLEILGKISAISPSLAGIFVTVGLMHKFVMPAEKISRKDYYAEEYELGPDEFEIIFYDIHVSIRVGAHEYDYMEEIMQKDALTTYMNKASVRVRIKVTEEEVEKLQKFLESEVDAKGWYFFIVHFTSCMSNINRAIERNTSISIPAGIDRSPMMSLAYFKTKKYFKDGRMQKILFIPPNKGAKGGHAIGNGLNKLIWDTMDSFLTGLFFLDFALAAQKDRTEDGWSFFRPNKDKLIKD